VTGPELDRLFATAVNASRRVHRATSFAAATRSVAGAAMDHLVRLGGGSLHGRRLLVVGAGEVAVVVVDHAVAAGAEVTVANRTLRRAQRLRDAGARVVDLAELDAWLGAVDVAVFATAAPHPLVDARTLRRVSTEPGLLLVDLSMPRNVSPDCRAVPGVEVLDLHDLEEVAARGPASVVRDVDTAERLVGEEADRYARWLATRTAAVHVRRLREDADAAARDEARRIRGRVPPELQGLVEQALLRTAHRLAHGATALMLEAAVDGDTGLVDRLAVVFAEPDLAPAAPEELAQTG
jgi:glutamyl-tRNA reductase